MRITHKLLDITILVLLLVCIGVRNQRLLGIDLSKQPTQQLQSQTEGTNRNISVEVEKYFPTADEWKESETSTFEVFSKGDKIGTILFSEPYTNKVIGFIGATPLFIAMDKEEKIMAVVLLDNFESPEYVAHVESSGLFNKWTGIQATEAEALAVDAVSGATYTSKAVIETLRQRISIYNQSEVRTIISMERLMNEAAIAILLIISVIAAYTRFKRNNKVRLAILTASLLILGVWQGRMLSVAILTSWVINGVPWSVQLGFAALALTSIVLPMFTGKSFYCAWVCPFGAAQELVGKCTKRKMKVGYVLSQWLKVFKRAILYAGLLLLIFGVSFDFTYIEPFTAFTPQSAGWAALVIAGISLILSVFISRPWCRYLCPMGEVFDIVRISKGKNVHKD